ncbi:MAG TPA: LPS export ABC transporter permease LptG [Sphingobium sp.]|uniref:LPS export ABC transporter permease LptG n=1 Tax=Sphingobium sp. TaxID=1912891 RepID=UPI002ED47DA0
MTMSFFPSRQIALYMGKTFLTRCIAMLAMLVLVLQVLDLLSEAGNVLAHQGNGEAQLWHYVSLRVPQIIATFLPFAVLLGTLITLTTLNANSEVISMKAAGLSAHQILAPLMLVAGAIAAISFSFNERVVVRSTATLLAWQAAGFGDIPPDSGVKANVWVRDGDDLVHTDFVVGRGNAVSLRGITIYDRAGGNLIATIEAPRGHREGNAWRLENAKRFDVGRGSFDTLGSIVIGSNVRPDQFTLAHVDADTLSYWELGDAIQELRAAGRPTAELEAARWHKIAGPLSTLLMPLLGAVAAFGVARSGKLFVRAVIGMALGFGFFVADNFALAMGDLGAYPPFLAAWAPFLLFLLVGETVLIYTEE